MESRCTRQASLGREPGGQKRGDIVGFLRFTSTKALGSRLIHQIAVAAMRARARKFLASLS